MTTLNSEVNMKKNNLKNYTMIKTDMKKLISFVFVQKISILITDKCFADIDNGSMGGNHWTCFYKKDNNLFYFDSFGGPPDTFLRQRIPKPITFYNFQSQNIESRLCGTYCLNFLLFNRKIGLLNDVLKNCFG